MSDDPFDHTPDDPLDQAINNARSGAEAAPPKAMPPNYKPPDHLETCQACHGTGMWRGRGQCFKCQGKGTLAFKTDSTTRSNARNKTVERKAQSVEAFKTTNPEVYAWMVSKAGSFPFALAMMEALAKYGDLTDNQLAACQKCIAKREAGAVAAKERMANAPEVSIEKIEEAFENAGSVLKWPKLTLGAFTFKPASATSKNAGAIYVTDGTEYIGKIAGGKFIATRDCGEERQERILEACRDPEGAAIAHGRLTGACACCGRTLSDPASVERGIGPICAKHYGW